MSNNNVHRFKQTFIKYNIFIRRRDGDGKWEVVKKIPDPRCEYDDATWKGARQRSGTIIKPLRWITHHVLSTRGEALDKAKEMAAAA